MSAEPLNSADHAASAPTDSNWTLKELGFAGVVIYGIWATIVMLSGSGFNPFNLELKFERIGQLGDAFGVLGAAMATAAAVFTWHTLNLEREETTRLRRREIERDAEDLKRRGEETLRQEAIAKAQKRQAAENTYFRLLDSRLAMLDSLGATFQVDGFNGAKNQRFVGLQAISQFIESNAPNRRVRYNDADEITIWLKGAFERHIDDFGHYFRFTYNIITFAKANFDRDAYDYVRILRAQLSDSEQLLIALNCWLGPGKGKFSSLIEEFALLNNISAERRKLFQLEAHFAPGAFEYLEQSEPEPPLHAF